MYSRVVQGLGVQDLWLGCIYRVYGRAVLRVWEYVSPRPLTGGFFGGPYTKPYSLRFRVCGLAFRA